MWDYSPAVIKAVRAALDFIYYAQLTSQTSESLACLKAAFYKFHEHKEIFVRLGQRDHFNIPKLHSMQHYLASIRSRGSADGYNTESPERLHIDYAKDAYCTTNKRDYIQQMTIWLRRQEAVDQFTAYLEWCLRHDKASNKDDEESWGDKEEGEEEGEVDTNEVPAVHRSFFLAAEPGPLPATQISKIVSEFHVPNFLPAVTAYLRQTHATLIPSETDRFDIYKHVSIPWNDICYVNMAKKVDRICATPSMPGKSGHNPTPAHFDTT